VAVTIALSALVSSHLQYAPRPEPVFAASSMEIPGTTSLYILGINSSSPSQPVQVTVDSSSSTGGVLALTQSGFVSIGSLCASGDTTFFSARTSQGLLSVSSDGQVLIDGVSGPSLAVKAGWHEVIVGDASSCSLSAPGGLVLVYGSPYISTVPRVQSGNNSFSFIVPYYSGGHSVAINFGSGVESASF
jgi:hypothetical protein